MIQRRLSRPSCSLLPPSAWPAEVRPQLLFATTGGAIGVLSRVENEHDARVLRQLQRNLAASPAATSAHDAALSHAEWVFQND